VLEGLEGKEKELKLVINISKRFSSSFRKHRLSQCYSLHP
jgi:hypothetical protein